MSRSNWHYVAAAVGIAILLAIIYSSYQIYQSSEQQRAHYSYQPAREPGRRVLMPSKAMPKGYEPNCENPDSNGNADLCAQWAAVDQVMESNRLASANVRLSLFASLLTLLGTIFVGWTLLETRNTSRRELRAYIFSERVGVYPLEKQTPRSENGKIGSTLFINNSGQTPAYHVVHWCALALHPVADEAALVAPSLSGLVYNTLPPGGSMHAHRRLPNRLTREEQTNLQRGVLALYVYGRIEYTDAFGATHYTNYRFAYAGWPLPPNLTMNFAVSGNDAS